MATSDKPVRHRLEYILFRIIACIVAAVPMRTAVRGARILAFLFARVLPQKMVRGHVARENLRLSFPDWSDDELERVYYDMWLHLFRLVAEVIQLPRKSHQRNMADVFRFRNRDAAVRALCSGRPVLVLGGHFGNWEVGNAAFGLFGFPVNGVARDLDNPYLHDWFAGIRCKSGGKLISKKGGGGEITDLLAARGLVGMLCDQDAGNRGLFVPFFGRDASTFKSIALLAMEFQAIILVCYSARLPDDFDSNHWVHYENGCEDIIDPNDFTGPDAIVEITRRYTTALEQVIRRYPEQYFWVHRRWKSQPQVRAKRVRAAA